MRKLIIKYLALDYRAKLFGRLVIWKRAANVIVPLMLLLGYSLIVNENYPSINLFIAICLVITAIAWAIPLWYLKKYPVQWHELDDDQKWSYGKAVIYGHVKAKFTTDQRIEWGVIEATILNGKQRFYNLGAFLVNPLAVVFLLVLIF